MDPGSQASAGRRTSPVRRGRARTLSGILLLAAGGALLAACSVTSPQPATPSAPESSAPPSSAEASRTPGAGEAPAAPVEALVESGPQRDAIAVAQASEHHVGASTLALAEAGVTYVVRAACTGEGWMRYWLTVDDREVSASRLRCGRQVVNTAFTAEGGERVRLHLDAPAEEGEGSLAEVVPAP